MELPLQIYQDLKDALPALEDALKAGVSYGGDLAHRFLMYDIAVNLFQIVISFIFFAASTYGALYAHKKALSDEDYALDDTAFVIFLTLSIATIISGLAFVGSLCTAPSAILKDIYIPEVRIIEVVGELDSYLK